MVTKRNFLGGSVAGAAVAVVLIGCAGCASPPSANSSIGGVNSMSVTASSANSMSVTASSANSMSVTASSAPGLSTFASAPNTSTSGGPSSIMTSMGGASDTDTSGGPSSTITSMGGSDTEQPLSAPKLPTVSDIASNQDPPALVQVGEAVNLIGDPWKLTAPPADFSIGSLTNATIYAKMLGAVPSTAGWTAHASSVSMVVGALHRQTDPDGHSIYAYLRLAGGLSCTPSVGSFDTNGAPLLPTAGLPCNVGILYPLQGAGDPLSVQGVA